MSFIIICDVIFHYKLKNAKHIWMVFWRVVSLKSHCFCPISHTQ